MLEAIDGLATLDEADCIEVNGGRGGSRFGRLVNLDINVNAANNLAINNALQIAIIVNSPGASVIQLLQQHAGAGGALGVLS